MHVPFGKVGSLTISTAPLFSGTLVFTPTKNWVRIWDCSFQLAFTATLQIQGVVVDLVTKQAVDPLSLQVDLVATGGVCGSSTPADGGSLELDLQSIAGTGARVIDTQPSKNGPSNTLTALILALAADQQVVLCLIELVNDLLLAGGLKLTTLAIKPQELPVAIDCKGAACAPSALIS